MIQSDALSRWPDFIPDKDMDNEDIMMLPDNLFIQNYWMLICKDELQILMNMMKK